MASKKKAEDGEVTVAKTPAELQRMRLEKLMKNPVKPVYIPDHSKAAKMKEPPEFIRNVWGSSAGAGSGDFHVYRGVRRREYARQKFGNEMNQKVDADDAYHQKVEENQKAAEERTAKKRAKRQKKKKNNKKMKKDEENKTGDSSEEGEEGKKKKEDKKGKEKESSTGEGSDQVDDDRSRSDSDTKDES